MEHRFGGVPSLYLMADSSCFNIAEGFSRYAPKDHAKFPTLTEGEPRGPIITGAENIGFQPVAAEHAPGKIAGKWMVKINGVWVETQSPIGVVR